jgi:isopenicillin N synthase-like dioxygenase
LKTQEIPVIDISPLVHSVASENDLQRVATEIRQACCDHGFFYIKGHGVSEQLQADLEAVSQSFFSLSEADKMKIAMPLAGTAWRGYFPVGNELTSGKPDLKEGIYFGAELEDDHPKVVSRTHLHGKNLFHPNSEQMRNTVLSYMDAVTKVGHALLRGVALSLGLTSDYFEKETTKDPFILFRIFHYPGKASIPQADWGVGEHTDYGLLTILKQDNIGGLQVKVQGKWIDAPPIPNTFVCNLGDMLDRMTGGLYRSTPHRVLNTSGKSRLSFPLFFDPGFDVHVKPIEGFASVNDSVSERWDNENIYKFDGPYGEYLVNKVSKVFPELFRSV